MANVLIHSNTQPSEMKNFRTWLSEIVFGPSYALLTRRQAKLRKEIDHDAADIRAALSGAQVFADTQAIYLMIQYFNNWYKSSKYGQEVYSDLIIELRRRQDELLRGRLKNVSNHGI